MKNLVETLNDKWNQIFVTLTNQLIETATSNVGERYSRQFNLSANPQNIIVRRSFGGQAARSVNTTYPKIAFSTGYSGKQVWARSSEGKAI